MGIFGIGVSALGAAQSGLLTTSHNIANASTPGYSRQAMVQGTNTHLFSGAGFTGQGVHIQTVKRIYDDFLGRQVLSAETGAAEMESYHALVSQIDNLLADPAAGLSPALAGFFKGVQDVAANPNSLAARQSMLSAAQSLSSRFQTLGQRLSEIRDGTNQQIAAQVVEINTYSSQLADINQRIILAQASGDDHRPNDLLDQRDQMLKDLNKLVRVTTVTQGDGSYNVYAGNGQPLVVGSQSYALRAVGASDDPQRTAVGIVGAGGTVQVLADTQITGGSLGGVLAFRAQALDPAQNALGRIALTLAQNVNDQQMLGQDLTGALGQALFGVSGPTVQASTLNSGSGVPAVSIDAASIAQLTTSDYQLSYVGGNYRLTRLADSQVQTFASLPQTVDGLTIAAGSWTPNANDSVLIQPTRRAAESIAVSFADPRLVAAAAPIRSAMALSNAGTGRISAGTVDGPPPTNPSLQDTIRIEFTSLTKFDVKDAANNTIAGNVSYTPGGDISYNGWTLQITGSPVSGDVFRVESNVNGVADNRNAQLLGALQTRNTMAAGTSGGATASYQAAYAQMVSAVGSKTNEVEAIGAARQNLVETATQAQQSLSGVNLDEEAANLLRYQQAYQAAAKVLEVASAVFDEIIALGR